MGPELKGSLENSPAALGWNFSKFSRSFLNFEIPPLRRSEILNFEFQLRRSEILKFSSGAERILNLNSPAPDDFEFEF